MKLLILSDLHLEFGALELPDTSADLVVLAGDIHLGVKGVRWAQQAFKVPVVYVPGNHEYYGGSLGHTLRKMRDAAKGSNVHVLDKDVFVLGNLRVLGATLWTDYRITGNQPLAQWDAQQTLADFKKVRTAQYSRAKPHDFLSEHVKGRAFLEDSLGQSFEGKTVVVTHHAPSWASVHPRYRDSKSHLSASYASNLEPYMGTPGIDLWVHGHTHDSMDYEVAGTRVVCNPRGYDGEDLNPDFNPSLAIEV